MAKAKAEKAKLDPAKCPHKNLGTSWKGTSGLQFKTCGDCDKVFLV